MTASALASDVVAQLGDTRLVVVANREPYIHVKQVRPAGLLGKFMGRKAREHLSWLQPASGLVTALDPVMRACGGTWVAHGSGSGDRDTSDAQGRVAVPPDDPSYTLRRVWLSDREEEGYYYGLANSALWPLCHIAYTRPVFDEPDWREYVDVNRRFADIVLEEIADTKAIVFVQDYHFALLPRMVKSARPDAVVCQFWHIPWPNAEAFRICPWRDEILDGLLGNDLLAFHLQYHCNNFLDTVDRTLEARVDRDHFAVHRGGHRTFVKPYPISIDPGLWTSVASGRDWTRDVAATRRALGINDAKLMMGVDRLDYTKGIPERIKAFERMLETRPEWLERVVFLQIGAPTRERLDRYQSLGAEVEAQVKAINARFGTRRWTPIVFRHEQHSPEQVGALYRAADACVVSSLHDGMNLVAKEFVAARTDELGVLVLSEFTGAARALADVVPVNPFAPDEFAAALHLALMMPTAEQRRRMRNLRQEVLSHTVFDWAGQLLAAACRLANGTR
ncbi:MAG: trehalose-6-phosphate synthase [Acidobacteriota bacterium]